jgi:hypothetical protein
VLVNLDLHMDAIREPSLGELSDDSFVAIDLKSPPIHRLIPKREGLACIHPIEQWDPDRRRWRSMWALALTPLAFDRILQIRDDRVKLFPVA